MKKLILISTVILLTFVSCDNARIKENQEQNQETLLTLLPRDCIAWGKIIGI
jgi:hypothetical protein